MRDHGLNTALVPTGGWRYEQPHKDGFQPIPPKGCAGTVDRLVEAVRIFRVQAHIDLGDVEGDIATYIKKVSPQNNRFPSKAQREAPRVKTRPIIERIRDRLLQIAGSSPRLRIIDEVHQRAEVCSGCQQNVKWMTGCVPCCAEIKERGQNLRRLPADPKTDGLGACRLHDFYLPGVIFVDRDDLGQSQPTAPAWCWMKTELMHNFDRIEEGDKVVVERIGIGYVLKIQCPGCKRLHILSIKGLPSPYDQPDKPASVRWEWNFDKKSPSLTPSVKASFGLDGAECCHFTLGEGVLNFYPDSTHDMSGTKQPLPTIQ